MGSDPTDRGTKTDFFAPAWDLAPSGESVPPQLFLRHLRHLRFMAFASFRAFGYSTLFTLRSVTFGTAGNLI